MNRIKDLRIVAKTGTNETNTRRPPIIQQYSSYAIKLHAIKYSHHTLLMYFPKCDWKMCTCLNYVINVLTNFVIAHINIYLFHFVLVSTVYE